MALPSADQLQKLQTEVDELTEWRQKYAKAIRTGQDLLEEEWHSPGEQEVIKEQMEIAREHLEKTDKDLSDKKQELEWWMDFLSGGSTN